MFLAGIEPIDSALGGLGAETKDHTHGPFLDLVNFNLLVICAANFSGNNYPEGLKFLYSTIQFFQKHPVLNRENTPSLDPQLDKLILSIDNKPVSELNNLWSIHNNGHYLPSVIYSVQVFGSPSEDRT